MDLEARWKAFQEAARRRGLRIYPGLPSGMLQGAAPWGGEPDGGEAFLDLARDLGVGLIYASAQPFDPEKWGRDLGDLEDLPPDLRTEAEGLLQEAGQWSGRLESFAAVWTWGGILHFYAEEAPWAADLEARKEALLEAAREREAAARMEEQAVLEDAARRLAEDRDFQEARTQEARIRLAQRRLPDLRARWPAEDRRWEELVRTALGLYEAEIRPFQEREMAQQARRMLEAGMKKTEAAARLGITRERLDRLLARYGEDEA
jgi:hypothetical protein